MTKEQMKTAAIQAHKQGDRATVSYLVNLAASKLHAPTRKPLAVLCGHIRYCWGID